MSPHPRKRTALTPEQRIDAREAIRLLDGTGLSLVQAAKKAIHGRQAIDRLPFSTVADRYTLSLVREKARGATLRWYENKLSPLLAVLGTRMIDDIERGDILAVGNAADVSDATRASYYRAIRAVFRWANAQEPPLVGSDVTEGLPTSARHDDEKITGILTVDETIAVMAGAGPHRSALALMLFAGLRPDELWGADKPPLRWKHILTAEKIIRVPAEVAKTRKARLIENLPDTVWSWLEPRGPEEQISLVKSRWLIRTAQIAAGFIHRQSRSESSPCRDNRLWTVQRPWPYDATRHSFATYALALNGDPGRVSLWLGHEGKPSLLYNNYRGLATKPLAEQYFAILRPKTVRIKPQYV